MRRAEWIELLLSTHASRVQATEILGMVADYLHPAQRFQKEPPDKQGALIVVGDGVTCTTVSLSISVGWPHWLSCYGCVPIFPHPDGSEFSVRIHEGIALDVADTRWPVSIGVVDRQDDYRVDLYCDHDIMMGALDVGSRVWNSGIARAPWPDNTVVTVRLTPSSISFAVNGIQSIVVSLADQNKGNCSWTPTVRIKNRHHEGCGGYLPNSNSFSFV